MRKLREPTYETRSVCHDHNNKWNFLCLCCCCSLDPNPYNLTHPTVCLSFALVFFLGRRQGDPGGDRRSISTVPGEGVDSRTAAGHQTEALLRALAGTGTDRAQTIRPAGGRSTEPHTALGDTTGAGQAAGRDPRVCPQVRRVQGKSMCDQIKVGFEVIKQMR